MMVNQRPVKILISAICLVATLVPVLASAQISGPNPNVGRGVGGARNNFFCPIGANSNIQVPCFLGGSGPAGDRSFGELIANILNILLLIVGSLAVLFLIIGGLRYLTAAGNEENSEAAKKTMTHAVVGLAIVILSFAVIYIVTSVLIEGRL